MTEALEGEGDTVLAGIPRGLVKAVQRLLFLASVISLLVVAGEAVIKIHRYGVEEYPGARLLWLQPHLGSYDRVGYANGVTPNLESARHFYRARYALAPRLLIQADVLGNRSNDLWVLDFETIEQLRDYCEKEGLDPIVVREDGTGLAGSLKKVRP